MTLFYCSYYCFSKKFVCSDYVWLTVFDDDANLIFTDSIDMLPGGVVTYYYTCSDRFILPEGLTACEFLYVTVRVGVESHRFDPVLVLPGYNVYIRAQLNGIIHEKSFKGPMTEDVRNRWPDLTDEMIFDEFNM